MMEEKDYAQHMPDKKEIRDSGLYANKKAMLGIIAIVIAGILVVVAAGFLYSTREPQEEDKQRNLVTDHPPDNSSSNIAKLVNFSCPEMNGFSFTYPVFKDWEVNGIRSNEQGRCNIFFNYPDIIDYEIAPQITVEKSTELGQKFILEELKGDSASENILDDPEEKLIGIMSAKEKNPIGVPYEFITDSSQYVKDHVFNPEDWDWLVFYGQDFGVRISRNNFGSLHYNIGEKQEYHDFDTDIFYKTIIESFSFVD